MSHSMTILTAAAMLLAGAAAQAQSPPQNPPQPHPNGPLRIELRGDGVFEIVGDPKQDPQAKEPPAKKGPIEIKVHLEGLNLFDLIAPKKDAKPAETNPKANAAAIERLEKALKQLRGPADQLNLKELASDIAEAARQLKGEPEKKPATTGRVIVVPFGGVGGGPGSGWGGPGSAPWMPGMPGGSWLPDDVRNNLPIEMRKELQRLIDEKAKQEKKVIELRLEQVQKLENLQKTLRARVEDLKKEERKVIEIRPEPQPPEPAKKQAADAPQWKIIVPGLVRNVPEDRRVDRLGIVVEAPSPIVVEQLQLPKGRGLVIVDVVKDSPADKAGLKTHDILIALNDRPVPNQPAAFRSLLDALKDAPNLDATAIRRGKEAKFEGLALPRPLEVLPMRLFEGDGAVVPDKGEKITISRIGGTFTIESTAGPQRISVTGRVAEGTVQVQQATIRTENQTAEYDNLRLVPEPYRGQIHRLVEMIKR